MAPFINHQSKIRFITPQEDEAAYLEQQKLLAQVEAHPAPGHLLRLALLLDFPPIADYESAIELLWQTWLQFHDTRAVLLGAYMGLMEGAGIGASFSAVLQDGLSQDSPWLIQEIGELAQKLEAQEPLNQAKTQYEALTSSQRYIYTTPYELLYDAGGQAANRIDLAKLLLSLSLCLPFFFSMERETGVGVLIETAGASRDVMRRKRLTAWLFALVCTAAAFLPRIVAVYQNYGLPELTAQANSLARFAALPAALPLWGVLALTMALWGLVACVGCVVVEAVSAKVRSPLPAALLCVLVLPGLTLLVFPL